MSDKRHPLLDMLTLISLAMVVLAISGCAGPVAGEAQTGGEAVNDTSSGQKLPMATTPAADSAQKNTALAELSPDAFMMSEGSPFIKFSSPWNDDVTNGTIYIAGTFSDKNTTTAQIASNGETRQLAVINGSFRTTANISGPTEIVLSAVDSNGSTVSSRILLDGDNLPAPYEKICGFDPLNPDSDSVRTAAIESGNGTLDGFELLDGRLPALVKCRAHAHPLALDTDADGLRDDFEILKLIPFCWSDSADTDKDGVPDPEEDIDRDGLTNAREQELGTDPLDADTDRDGLTDKEETIYGTNATLVDSDSDGLKDGFEVKVCSDPLKPDSDSDGVPDSDELHTYPFSLDMPRVDVAITGKGDIITDFRAGTETSEYYAGHPAGRGPLIRIFPNDRIESMDVTLPYPENITSPGNLAIACYNDSIGMFLPVDSVVDEINRTVCGHVDLRAFPPSQWGDLMVRVFDVQALHDLNLEIAAFNAPLSAYMPEDKVVRVEIPDTVNISVISRGPDGRLTVTNRSIRFLPTESEVNARL